MLVKGSVTKELGLGKSVPPIKEHVVIYFSQQRQSEQNAIMFYDIYEKAEWKNKKGVRIKNWKVHAWKWIWNN